MLKLLGDVSWQATKRATGQLAANQPKASGLGGNAGAPTNGSLLLVVPGDRVGSHTPVVKASAVQQPKAGLQQQSRGWWGSAF